MSGIDESWKRILSLLVSVALVVQLASCGTLLYPERDGQKSGEIDIAVVLMDAIGLLFFVIPGVVAFAVDFHTGAIYLPPGHPRSRQKGTRRSALDSLQVLRVDPAWLNAETITAVVSDRTGIAVRLDDPALVVSRMAADVDIAAQLERLSPTKGARPCHSC